MDGDIAPLKEIFQVCRNNNAALMVDEAHATGVLGKNGRGALELYELEGKVDIVMGTLSKSLCGVGGFIGGSKELIRILKHTARAFVFSAYMPPSVCASVLAALRLIDQEPERRTNLWRNAERMRGGLRDMGFRLTDSQSPIIPVIFPSEEITNLMTKGLRDAGIYVCPVIFPAVKKDLTRIRLTVMATHTEQDIDKALHAFKYVHSHLKK
jgi:7-keto-8-aminopelargonate synthetase-like enzyme